MSKVQKGTLTFTAVKGGSNTPQVFSCQVTAVSIEPAAAETGGTNESNYVLCGDPIPASASAGGSGLGDKLNFTIVSDHNVANGAVAWSWAHRGEIVSFEFTPAGSPDEGNGAAAQTFRGTVKVDPPLAIGGEVQGDLRISGSWSIESLTPPSAYGTGYGANKSNAVPGQIYSAEASVTAEDQTNATKLGDGTGVGANKGLGYIPVPKSAWVTGEFILVGTYKFHWDGAKWAPGAAA